MRGLLLRGLLLWLPGEHDALRSNHVNPREGIATEPGSAVGGRRWLLRSNHVNPREGIATQKYHTVPPYYSPLRVQTT